MSVDDRLSPQSSSSQSPPPIAFNLMIQAHHLHHQQQQQQQQQQQHQTIKNLFFQQQNISPIQKEMSLHMLNQAKDLLNLSNSSLPSSPSSSSRLSLSPSPSLKSDNPLKNLQRDRIVSDDDDVDDDDDDEDQEIEVDDVDHDYRKSIIANTINFSISNILSDNFGRRELCVARSNTKNLLFRPYDLNGIINQSDNSNNNNNNNKSSANRNKTTKLPSSLGGLCKTISQIGQHVQQQSIATSANFSLSNSSMLPLSRTISDSGVESSDDTRSESGCSSRDEKGQELWPAWVYCTRYSDRPSSGPRYRRPKQPKEKGTTTSNDDKRPRTAFSSEQLARLKQEFIENRYLTERRRQQLSNDLGLNEAQIKIWFQNKRAKIKKSSGQKNPLAMQLMAQGLYNHTTVPLTKEEEELEMRMNGQL